MKFLFSLFFVFCFFCIILILCPVYNLFVATNNQQKQHVKQIVSEPYTYTVRSLCLDYKEYFFINGQSSVVLPNSESGNIKSCDY